MQCREEGDCSLSLWWSENINQWFSVCRPHSACSVLLDIELWRAQSLWKNDGLGKTRQCNSEFSNTLHKNWLHDKFCFVLCSNKTKSLLTILTITQRITDYKTSLLGVKWNIQWFSNHSYFPFPLRSAITVALFIVKIRVLSPILINSCLDI